MNHEEMSAAYMLASSNRDILGQPAPSSAGTAAWASVKSSQQSPEEDMHGSDIGYCRDVELRPLRGVK